MNSYYSYADPEKSSGNIDYVNNHLTIDRVGVTGRDWAVIPRYGEEDSGYAYKGENRDRTEDFAWTVWVR